MVFWCGSDLQLTLAAWLGVLRDDWRVYHFVNLTAGAADEPGVQRAADWCARHRKLKTIPVSRDVVEEVSNVSHDEGDDLLLALSALAELDRWRAIQDGNHFVEP